MRPPRITWVLPLACLLGGCTSNHTSTSYGATTLESWQVNTWSGHGGHLEERLVGPDGVLVEHVYNFEPSPDGSMAIVTRAYKSESVLYDLRRAQPVVTLAQRWDGLEWAPDSTALLLLSHIGVEAQGFTIWMLDVRSPREAVAIMRLERNGGLAAYDWSPDGRRFAFIVHETTNLAGYTRPDDRFSLWTWAVGSGAARQAEVWPQAENMRVGDECDLRVKWAAEASLCCKRRPYTDADGCP